MKLVKQLLSTLLVMALAFSLLLPVAYAEEGEAVVQEIVAQEVDAQEVIAQDAPVITITTQPKASTVTVTKKEVLLSAEAKTPEGINGTLRYQWYQLDKDGVAMELAGETASTLRVRPTYEDLDGFLLHELLGKLTLGPGTLRYRVRIICDYTEDGQEKSVNAESETVKIYVRSSLADCFHMMWDFNTFVLRMQPKDIAEKVAKWAVSPLQALFLPFGMILSAIPVFIVHLIFLVVSLL